MLPARSTIRAIDAPILVILIDYEQNNSYPRPERVYGELGHWSGSILLHKAETGSERKRNFAKLLHSSMLPACCTITAIDARDFIYSN